MRTLFAIVILAGTVAASIVLQRHVAVDHTVHEQVALLAPPPSSEAEVLAKRVADLEHQLQKLSAQDHAPYEHRIDRVVEAASHPEVEAQLLNDSALMVEREREYVQTTTAPMNRQLQSEGIDRVSTQEISDSIARVLGNRATIVDLQCASTLCRMEIAAEHISSDEALRAVLMEGRYGEAFYHRQQGGEVPVTVLYVSRDGRGLPRS
jgi:hypothetical protein